MASRPSIDAQAFFDSINGRELANSVVRVVAQDRDGTQSLGSGTLVESFEDGSGLVVTNNHVVADAASATTVSVVYRNGERSSAVIRDADATWDIAVLEVSRAPANARPVAVVDAEPQRGEILAIAGYGDPSSKLLFQMGTISQRLAPRPGLPFEQFELRPCKARQGDSGGPVFNARGRMCGVLWGAGEPSFTACTPGRRILALIQRIREAIGRRPRGQLVGPLVPVQRPNQHQQPPVATQPPPAEPASPHIPNGSEPAAAGELARLRDELQAIRQRLENDKQAIGEAVPPAIADGAKSLAEDAIEAAGPTIVQSLASKLGGWALTALGGLTGFGLPVGGVAAASWLFGKAGLFVARWWKGKRARKALGAMTATAATKADTQGLAASMDAGGGKDAPSFSSFNPQAIIASEVSRLADALKSELQGTIDAKLSVIGQRAKATAEIVAAKPDPAPTFVPTQVNDPNAVALKSAIEKLGSLGPQEAAFARKLYSIRDVLLNQAIPT